MKRDPGTFIEILRVIWRHSSAGAALVLIVLALIIGYRIGRPAPEPVEATDTGAADSGEPQTYTCSMHPTVRLPDPDTKCPICFMDLIPVVEGAGSETQLVLSEDAARLSGVETARVSRFFPMANVRLYGKLAYDETSVARISAYFPGRLDRLFVNYVGVPVARGDHLAEIYSPQLLAAFEELRQAHLAVDQSVTTSEIVRSSTERTLAAAREKLRLLGLTGEQVAAAERGERSSDKLTIYTPIGGVVTHLAAREGDYVETGDRIATVADLSHLWLDLEAYESQLPMLRWGQAVTFTVEAHPGELFEGRVSFIEPIVDDRTRTAAVRVAVDNLDLELKPGMFATATIRPRVASGGAVLSDELAGRWVGPMHPTIVKDGPGACDVCGMDLVPAESLGVVGDPAEVEEPLVIPRTAAMLTGRRAVVYVAVPETESPTYEAREVMLGPVAGDFYIVESGLNEGDEVVVSGAFRIDSAMQILAKPSMMMPGDGSTTDGESNDGRVEAPERFVSSLTPVYAAYLDAQEALADDDLETYQFAWEDLVAAVGFVEETGVVGEALGAWRRAAVKLTPDGPAESIDDARAAFEHMSNAVIALEATFGHAGRSTWHVAHCPMAFDFKGAVWLQRGETIDNPYFGAEMLRCGTLRDARPPKGGAPAARPASRPDEREGRDHE
ncbi:MAG: efflux RND transporter periplasmic adaptor subunit [Planctomycetota bacterium]|jgi:Cu(I)/Ag(I) efflux system membrane fusion protein